jgi:hypothetical protein
LERLLPNAGDAVGDRVSSNLSRWALDERRLVLIVQDPIHTAIGEIERIHSNCGQAGAISERPIPNAGDAVRDRHGGQAGAAFERLTPNAGDAVADRNGGQAAAVLERLLPNAGDAVGDRVSSNLSRWALDERRLALIEQDPIHTAIGEIERIHSNCGQAAAVSERPFPNAGDAVGDRHAGQTAAVIERPTPNTGDAVGDRHGGQAGAASERLIPNAGHGFAFDRRWDHQ